MPLNAVPVVVVGDKEWQRPRQGIQAARDLGGGSALVSILHHICWRRRHSRWHA